MGHHQVYQHRNDRTARTRNRKEKKDHLKTKKLSKYVKNINLHILQAKQIPCNQQWKFKNKDSSIFKM